jgi:hypothetical protein
MLGITEIVVMSTFSIIGAVIIMHFSFINWRKKKQIDYDFELKKIKLRSRRKPAPKSKPLGIMDYVDKLRGLNPDTINTILDFATGQQEEQPDGIEDSIINFAKSNPDIVKSFLDGLGSGKKTTDTDIYK